MSGILRWILAHPIPAAEIVLLLSLSMIIVVAFFQGKELSLLPPRIGGRPLKRGGAAAGDAPRGVFEAIRVRKSVRSYQDRPVEHETILKLMEAARLAPSASNRQEWRFVVADDRETVSRLAAASCIRLFTRHAPCIIAACAATDGHVMQCGQPSYPIDVAIALDHLSLAAVELGLGTCWIGMCDEKKVRGILGIPGNVRLVCLMTLGYPTDPAGEEKKRRPIGDIVKFNRW